MIDHQTGRPIRVSTDGNAGPYLLVPVGRLDQIRDLLTRERIAHWVESDAISLDDKPEVAVINLGLGGDAPRVQALLDGSGTAGAMHHAAEG